MKAKMQKIFKDADQANIAILIAAFIVVFVVLSLILGTHFISKNNFLSMASQLPEFGFMAMAIAFCMITGGTDFSIVAVANLTTIVCCKVILACVDGGMSTGSAIALGFVVGLLVALACGVLNGFLRAVFKINALLITMATMMFYSGIGMIVTKGKTISGLPLEFMDIGLIKLLGIPLFFWVLIIVAFLMIWVLSYTEYGKTLYLYGTSHTVALFTGMPINKLLMETHVLASFFAGIGGLLMLIRVCSASVSYGDTYLLQAILVCALGGINALGGRGSLIGVLISMFVLQMLQSGFTLLGFEAYYKNFIWGIVLIVVLISNYYLDRLGKKTPKELQTR